jgi:D-aminoacyl-tRNA deacylase
MRAVIQRVTEASVTIAGELTAHIGRGVVVLVGVRTDDSESDAAYVAGKIPNLRIFEDADGKMNRALVDVGGAALLVSQFTLYGDARKGRRPSFIDAAAPPVALDLYQLVCDRVAGFGVPVAQGVFGADMQVSLVNDGPVTVLLDSRREF